VDVKDGRYGFDTLDALGFAILPETPMAHTASGGLHLYFAAPDVVEIACTEGDRGSGIGVGPDWRGSGGYVILPSPGSGYSWDPHWNFDTVALAQVPPALFPRGPERTAAARPVRPTTGLSPYAEAALDSACRRIIEAPPGQQEGTLNAECFSTAPSPAPAASLKASPVIRCGGPPDSWLATIPAARGFPPKSRPKSTTLSRPARIALARCAAMVERIWDSDPERYAAAEAERQKARDKGNGLASATLTRGVSLSDFYAYMPTHTYIFAPACEMWPKDSVNARIPPISVGEGPPRKASIWLDQNRPVSAGAADDYQKPAGFRKRLDRASGRLGRFRPA
jgi:hypothetical protein